MAIPNLVCHSFQIFDKFKLDILFLIKNIKWMTDYISFWDYHIKYNNCRHFVTID